MAEDFAPFPVYTPAEKRADGVVHALGVGGSLIAVIALIAYAAGREGANLFSLGVYGAGMLAMFGCSAAYNMVEREGLKAVLRRLDHAAIFLMIAGTYTPVAVMVVGGLWGYGLLAVVWAVALFGVPMKLFAPDRLSRWAVPLYLIQGWALAVAVDPLVSSTPPSVLWLLVAGGVLYTSGVAFHLWQSLPFQNAIWHSFVLAGAACHYLAILDVVAPLPVSV